MVLLVVDQLLKRYGQVCSDFLNKRCRVRSCIRLHPTQNDSNSSSETSAKESVDTDRGDKSPQEQPLQDKINVPIPAMLKATAVVSLNTAVSERLKTADNVVVAKIQTFDPPSPSSKAVSPPKRRNLTVSPFMCHKNGAYNIHILEKRAE